MKPTSPPFSTLGQTTADHAVYEDKISIIGLFMISPLLVGKLVDPCELGRGVMRYAVNIR